MFWFLLLLLLLLLPIFFLLLVVGQAIHTRKTAIRLPEANGQRLHTNGNLKSLLHIGESTVAGVGVADLSQGLTANIIKQLQRSSDSSWDWQVLGSNGARVGEVLDWHADNPNPDVLVVTFGVNDSTKFTSITTWLQHLQAGVDLFAGKGTQVLCTGVPPLANFPLLPFPLNRLLGWRARRLDQALAGLCQLKGWLHIDLQFEAIAHLMAEDGYHPNAEGYQVWGSEVAKRILTLENSQ